MMRRILSLSALLLGVALFLFSAFTVCIDEMGRLGGRAMAARAAPPGERKTAARKAIKARWDAYYKQHLEKLKAKLEKTAKAKKKAK